MSNIEQTLSIIKPDAVERNLENEIKEIFKNKGFSILKEKKIQIEKSEAENNFIKFMKQNHFTTIYANTYLQVQLLSWHFKKKMQF